MMIHSFPGIGKGGNLNVMTTLWSSESEQRQTTTTRALRSSGSADQARAPFKSIRIREEGEQDSEQSEKIQER